MAYHQEDRDKVKKGVIVTLIGKLAELSQGLYLFLARYLFGGEQFGLFIIGFNLIELISRFLVGGFGDAATFYSAKYLQDSKHEAKLYQSLSTLIIFPLLFSVLAAIGVHLSIDWIYEQWWTQHSSHLIDIMKTYVYLLPLSVLVKTPLAAIRGHMEMAWPVAIENTALPLLHLVTSVVFWKMDSLNLGLVYASIISYGILVPLSWYAFSRYFSLGKLIRHISISGEVLKFSIPQSMNMMMNFGLVKVDGIMLSAFLSANHVGIYTLIAELFRSIRSAKTSFSGIYAPLVAKYKSLGNQLGIQDSLQSISIITAKFSFPILFVIMLFFPELLSLENGYWEYSWAIPWLLALGPMLSCFFGLAGNTLLMMGYTKTLLVNSISLMGVNVLLNYLLIPSLGILGASLATAISGLGISMTQMFQLKYLEGIRFNYWKLFQVIAIHVPILGVLASIQYFELDRWILSEYHSYQLIAKIILTFVVLGPYAIYYIRQGIPKKSNYTDP